METEIWKPSRTLPRYEVSSLGRIRALPVTRPMPRGGVRIYGGTVGLGQWDSVNKRYVLTYRRKTYRVARLVCEAFNGPPPADKPLCLHTDENGRNNRPENLRWGTSLENMHEPIYLALRRRMSLNEADVRAIRASAAPSSVLAPLYGVSTRTIRCVQTRKTWSHVNG